MTTEPKLLTEAEAREMYTDSRLSVFIEQLRERGLIAVEPVDPLLVEARQTYAVWCEDRNLPGSARRIRDGEWDDTTPMVIALAALRRGMELEREKRPVLTREMVRVAVQNAGLRCHVGAYGYSDYLHTALQEQLK